MSRNSLCCVFNTAPHYRSTIYELMDKELKADFYFGDRRSFKLKLMDYTSLIGFKGMLKSKKLWIPYYYQLGAFKLLFKPYSKYVITGDLNCLSTWLILLCAPALGKKIFLWTHGYYGNEGRVKRLLKKIYFSLSEGVFLYGEHARNMMIAQGYKATKLHLIYNSLNYNTQLEVREKLSPQDVFKGLFAEKHPTVVFIGRIEKRKRIDMVIQVMASLKTKNVMINLLLIGEYDSSLNLDVLANRLNVNENICFYGPCYNEEKIGSLIYNAKVCVSPGNVGLTAMHVLSYGTPLLTSNNFQTQRPEFEAIMPGITGDFFQENSIVDLEDKLLNWINLSPVKREEVRQEAYRVIDKKYNPHRQIETLRRVLNLKPN